MMTYVSWKKTESQTCQGCKWQCRHKYKVSTCIKRNFISNELKSEHYNMIDNCNVRSMWYNVIVIKKQRLIGHRYRTYSNSMSKGEA